MLGMRPSENVSLSQDDTSHLPYRVFRDGREAPTEQLPMQRAAREGSIIQGEMLEILRADGTRIAILMNATPVRDDQGTIKGAVGACVDVTELRAAESALREADRLKDEFLAMLAHELRNPLAAVSNAVQVARRSKAEDDRAWARAVIEDQVCHLSRIIDDLLDVSRISRGKIQLRRQAVDMNFVIDHAVEAVRPLIDERKHRLTVTTGARNLRVEGDPTRLEQVVANLLNNAAKYTEAGGRIDVECRAEGDQVVVSVRDTGVGIAPEQLPNMFELFAQADRSLARSEGGLGIGLTLAKRLVELHRGTIEARSEGPGRGSEFTVRLPAQAGAAPGGGAGTSVPDADRSRGLSILVVDDNVPTALGMARLLKLSGHRVEVLHDGQAAVDAARRHCPEVVLLDIGLPGIDGYQVARALRREETCRDALIVAVSGYGQDEDKRRSREAGFDAHMVKPVDVDALLKLIGERTTSRVSDAP
jgi:signal transduction histidine kinase/ActR/RegA family two-component response regulator